MDDEDEEVCAIPWPVYISAHARKQAMERFALRSDEEAQAFIRQELGRSTSARKRRDGALRWTTDVAQIITKQYGTDVRVITCYPTPPRRSWTKKKKVTWRHEEDMS